MRRLLVLGLLVGGIPLAFAGKPKACVSADQAAQMLHKDVCIAAHVYEVVELPDGTRFLDVCSPETPDEGCRFTIVSLWADRETVGELRKYRDADIQMRGTVERLHGRAGMLLSHARQFYGGPPKFRPNPKLARGFTAEEARPAVGDPNLRRQGQGRAFMNSREKETLPGK